MTEVPRDLACLSRILSFLFMLEGCCEVQVQYKLAVGSCPLLGHLIQFFSNLKQ